MYNNTTTVNVDIYFFIDVFILVLGKHT